MLYRSYCRRRTALPRLHKLVGGQWYLNWLMARRPTSFKGINRICWILYQNVSSRASINYQINQKEWTFTKQYQQKYRHAYKKSEWRRMYDDDRNKCLHSVMWTKDRIILCYSQAFIHENYLMFCLKLIWIHFLCTLIIRQNSFDTNSLFYA